MQDGDQSTKRPSSMRGLVIYARRCPSTPARSPMARYAAVLTQGVAMLAAGLALQTRWRQGRRKAWRLPLPGQAVPFWRDPSPGDRRTNPTGNGVPSRMRIAPRSRVIVQLRSRPPLRRTLPTRRSLCAIGPSCRTTPGAVFGPADGRRTWKARAPACGSMSPCPALIYAGIPQHPEGHDMLVRSVRIFAYRK